MDFLQRWCNLKSLIIPFLTFAKLVFLQVRKSLINRKITKVMKKILQAMDYHSQVENLYLLFVFDKYVCRGILLSCIASQRLFSFNISTNLLYVKQTPPNILLNSLKKSLHVDTNLNLWVNTGVGKSLSLDFKMLWFLSMVIEGRFSEDLVFGQCCEMF